ncbi:hypothetical protein FRC09_007746, partial [Ceratobasidium sp. 395]
MSSSTIDSSNPAIKRVRISDDTGGCMPTHGSAIPKPPVDLQAELDDYGSELARDARIWPAYVREAEKWDEDMVDGWNRSLDVILGTCEFIGDASDHVFIDLLRCQYSIGTQAALFSAISTAFVIESSKNLKPDPSEATAASMLVVVSVLHAIAEGRPANTSPEGSNNVPEFTPPFAAVCVNTLWFLSLSLGVSVSLVAMLAKQWCHSYMSGRTGQPHVQARRRQRRLDGLERWKMAGILSFLPTLMHLSLSLTIYLWSIHTTVAIPVLIITTLTFVFYVATTILPVGNPHCPYTTPLSRYIEATLRKLLASFNCTSSASPFLSQHEIDPSTDLSGSLSDDLTSRALGWLITNSEDTRSVDLALQAIAGADARLPAQPLIQCGVVSRLVGRFIGCFTVHRKTGYIGLASDTLSESASLYGRALAFVISNAPDQVAVASELRAASGTAQDKRVRSIDQGYSYLEEEFILKKPNTAAFGAANMSTWREFWGRIEWPWPNVPLGRTSAIIERHLNGEITLHPTAVVTLVETMSMEAPRWLHSRIPEHRGHAAMRLVRLLMQTTQHPPNPTRFATSVTLAVFALSINDYPGGNMKPSPESRMRRAMDMLRLYSKFEPTHDYENLLVLGLLGLLQNPQAYILTSENIAAIASSLSLVYSMDKDHAPLPFLPLSFDTEKHFLEIVLGLLCPSAELDDLKLDETTKGTLLGLLVLRPHIWAHDLQVCEMVIEILNRAGTEELQKKCLEAIGSQWAHIPSTPLLKTLFDYGTFEVILRLLAGRNSTIAQTAMHSLWMIISKTLELLQDENTYQKPTFFDAGSALRRAVENGLFVVLAGSFSKVVEPPVPPHYVDMWVWVFENMSRMFSQEMVESNVLLIMADFYDLNFVGETIRQIMPNGTG